jgi:hypothetical protein
MSDDIVLKENTIMVEPIEGHAFKLSDKDTDDIAFVRVVAVDLPIENQIKLFRGDILAVEGWRIHTGVWQGGTATAGLKSAVNLS